MEGISSATGHGVTARLPAAAGTLPTSKHAPVHTASPLPGDAPPRGHTDVTNQGRREQPCAADDGGLAHAGRAGREYGRVEIEAAERFPVVALVSSAGGLDALTRVLAPLPPGFPAAV